MKCVICGKNAVLNALCKDCSIHKNPLLEGYKKFSVKHCVDCDKWNTGHSWRRVRNPEAVFVEKVKKHMKLATTSKVTIFVDLVIPEHKKNAGVNARSTAEVEIEKMVGEETLRDSYSFPFTIEHTYCGTCCKKGTEYFEGVIQLRGEGQNFDDAYAFLKKEISKVNDKGMYINKEVTMKKGVDLYITSQRRLPKIIESVYKQFGGTMKISEQLFTHNRQTSKDLYRVNAYLLLPSFGVRDVIAIKKDFIQVTSVNGKKVVGTSLKTGKKVSSLYDEYELIASSEQFVTVQVVKKIPSVEVLHPETYQSTPVVNAKDVKKKEIEIIEIEKELFIVS
jgi:NMD protein affecting ribosome stability and mRNA decay